MAGFTHSQVAVGSTVIVVGASWSTSQRWPWILVSLDAGHTWNGGLSWSGRPQGCVGDIVALGQRVVLRDCSDADVSLWVTDLPESAPAPSSP